MDYSLPGSSVHGTSKARMLEWIAIPSFRGSSWTRDRTHISYIGRQILYHWAAWESQTTRKVPIYFFLNDFFPHTPYSSSLPPSLTFIFPPPLPFFLPFSLLFSLHFHFPSTTVWSLLPFAALVEVRNDSGPASSSLKQLFWISRALFFLIVSTLLFNHFSCALLHLPIKGKCLTFTLKVQVSFIHRYLLTHI